MNDQPLPWEEIEHTADWALRVYGEDRRALFENTAQGMVSLVEGQVDLNQPDTHHVINLDAPNLETLLVDWLTELIYMMEDSNFVFTTIKVNSLENLTLQASVSGRPGGDVKKHIKAATYHDLNIRQTDNGYQTTIVFDV